MVYFYIFSCLLELSSLKVEIRKSWCMVAGVVDVAILHFYTGMYGTFDIS